MLFIMPVLRAVWDRRERDKLQEMLPSVTRFKEPVSQRATCVATKLRDELQEKLPSVTAPTNYKLRVEWEGELTLFIYEFAKFLSTSQIIVSNEFWRFFDAVRDFYINSAPESNRLFGGT